jgi:hypothetical protein
MLSAVLGKFSDLAVVSALLLVSAARFNANPGGINGKDI